MEHIMTQSHMILCYLWIPRGNCLWVGRGQHQLWLPWAHHGVPTASPQRDPERGLGGRCVCASGPRCAPAMQTGNEGGKASGQGAAARLLGCPGEGLFGDWSEGGGPGLGCLPPLLLQLLSWPLPRGMVLPIRGITQMNTCIIDAKFQ